MYKHTCQAYSQGFLSVTLVFVSLQQAVLGVLEAGPMTGYDLTRFFESSARWVWSAPQSQIYPLLRKLEAEGLIEGEEQIRGEKLRRTSYSITPAGHRNLGGWLIEAYEEPNIRDPLLLKALFFDMVDAGKAELVLRNHVEELQANIEQWAVHRTRLLARDTPLLQKRLRHRDEEDHERIARLKAHVFDYLIDSARLRIEWAERAIELLHLPATQLDSAGTGR